MIVGKTRLEWILGCCQRQPQCGHWESLPKGTRHLADKVTRSEDDGMQKQLTIEKNVHWRLCFLVWWKVRHDGQIQFDVLRGGTGKKLEHSVVLAHPCI